MKINTSPVFTCNHYGINNIEVFDDEIVKKQQKFNAFLKNGIQICQKEINLEHLIKQKSNLALEIVLDGKKNNQNGEIEFNFDEKNNFLVEDLQILTLKNTTSNLNIRYNISPNAYHNGSINIVCEKNSHLSLNIITTNPSSLNLSNITFSIEENATLSLGLFDFSSGKGVYRVWGSLCGKSSKIDLKNIYFNKQNAVLDLNYYFDVQSQMCDASMNSIGILSGKAQKNFKGTIDFENGSKKSCGTEKEFCLLLSDTCRAKALPILLCEEEDVSGFHSTSVGKIDKNVMFYLLSRGLSEKEAKRLYVNSKLSAILSEVDSNLSSEILDRINKEI